MNQIDEMIQKRVGHLWNEMVKHQLYGPPVLTNGEASDEVQQLESNFDAICVEHGIGEEELEVIAAKYSNL